METNIYFKMGNARIRRKKVCDNCGIETRRPRIYYQKFLCWNCYQKEITHMYIPGDNTKNDKEKKDKIIEELWKHWINIINNQKI